MFEHTQYILFFFKKIFAFFPLSNIDTHIEIRRHDNQTFFSTNFIFFLDKFFSREKNYKKLFFFSRE